MYRLLLLVLAHCSSSSGRAPPHDTPWHSDGDVSNLQLLHPVNPSSPDEPYSNIPAEAFSLDSSMTKRTFKNEFNNKRSPLEGVHASRDLSNVLQQPPDDMYVIVVKKHEDNGGSDVTAGIADDDQTTDDEEQRSLEYYTPADSNVHHGAQYFGPLPFTDDHKPRSTDDTNMPLHKKESSHSLYFTKDFNSLDNLDDVRYNRNRVIPKMFPSKYMTNANLAHKVVPKPQPRVVYVNKDVSANDKFRVYNGQRAMYRAQDTLPLPMTVYVDKNEYHDYNHDKKNTKTLEEVINEMHDTRFPKPIKVYITKEEPQQEESDADAGHLKHLMHQIRALNKLLHGDNAPEPYTMYVDNQVIISEETPTGGGQQERDPLEHLATVGGDGAQSVVQAICSELGAALCAGDLQISRRDDERTKIPYLVTRDKVRRQQKPPNLVPLTAGDTGRTARTLWSVFNNDKGQKLKQYVLTATGQQTFII